MSSPLPNQSQIIVIVALFLVRVSDRPTGQLTKKGYEKYINTYLQTFSMKLETSISSERTLRRSIWCWHSGPLGQSNNYLIRAWLCSLIYEQGFSYNSVMVRDKTILTLRIVFKTYFINTWYFCQFQWKRKCICDIQACGVINEVQTESFQISSTRQHKATFDTSNDFICDLVISLT